jgi:hypothetical protein
MISSASFARAHDAYLQPPNYPESRVQIEGCFEVSAFEDLKEINTGELDDINVIDAGFDPETETVKIWISGWLDCEPNGDWNRNEIGGLLSPEVVDTDGVDFGPDPDEEYDNRDFGDD